MKDYIELANATEAPPNQEVLMRAGACIRDIHACFGLATEVGELTDIFKRAIFYGKEVDHYNVREELGDILWYMAILCNKYKFPFEEVMEVNIAKLRKRFPEKFKEFDALNRNLDEERKILEQ